ncbi:MAG: sulfotransferase domain-containing protein [Rhodobacteraceae bacterium]|nr:sulfotransferase domain-containing protein [Paracoccaceae bacterium]
MKSGTTTLFRLLAQHPEIARPREKEPGFFSQDERWAKGVGDYQSLWEWKPRRHKVALEATTGYTKFPFEPQVPERMSTLTDCEFRFVYLVRDPFKRIESHILHGLHRGWNKSLDAGFDGNSYPIEITRYAKQLDRFTAYFPKSSILVATLDELNNQPAQLLRRVCEHAGVDPDFNFEKTDQVANPGTRYRRAGWVNRLSESRNPVLRPVRRFARWLLGNRRVDALASAKPVQVDLGRNKLTDEERQRVLGYIGEDLKRLRSEYGVDAKALWGIDV